MEDDIRKLLYYIFSTWISGYVFSTIKESYFIRYIRIPDWLNKILFLFRTNKPVSFIAVGWQIIFMTLSIFLLLLFRLNIIPDLRLIIKIFSYTFGGLFVIIGLLITVDRILYFR